MRQFLGRLQSLPLLVVLVVTSLAAQNAAPAKAPKRPTSTPYTGDLSIFESPGRDQRLQINRVMDILGIVAGKGVADIGAGSGWFTVWAARRVGAPGTVYAVDINPEAIHYIDQRVRSKSLPNVKTILSKSDDPMLLKDAVDAVLLLKTYHEVSFYPDDAALVDGFARVVEAALKVGNTVIAVAVEPHRAGILKTLRGTGIDVDAVLEDPSSIKTAQLKRTSFPRLIRERGRTLRLH